MLKAKLVSAVLIIIGVLTLLTSLIYANFETVNSILNIPRLEIPEINIPQIKLPLIGNAKPTNENYPKIDSPSSTGTCSGTALCVTDKITKIVDGDTLYTEHYRIRLALANTPEQNAAGFSDATSFAAKTCPVGTMASIDQDDMQKTDVYGRMVAKVTCSDINLNAALLESRHAKILTQYCSKSEFATDHWAKNFGC